ncbi:hypothetical protein FNF27_07649 [Cafeteria roenbergensis]|uniref:DUF1330 domain-containing protein n=1 Tax=Cafeteria roenbergensis TaxID=33653 RepID=A0A5A8BZS3_CAFRO|nr:hypothetical protein FNF31_07871 [Cafeteria roenbergensis]KAA0153553.1 hypothetical protein FNF29_02942 [Cafeteria roenbergensis]KAA0159994.1 hypothetical protein FNF31_04639 [Cafeteria roenbergensis]KAA0162538.1 hypothetical protein FNF28_04632 [Cafeteria roenbergensis]KAA0165446.1 hypothetical protein FNF27_07649 [Cafeteria roenbergensis]|eukprot:KAA0153553.1 hypothetical protein FNF29_02942 [Cafeteria roenbergensis]
MAGAAAHVKYTVTAKLAAEHEAGYVAWLKDGHVQAIVDEGGACVARVEQCGCSEEGVACVKSVYVFPSRDAFSAYETGLAPKLREDGIRRYGPSSERPVAFSREVVDVEASAVGEEAAKEGAYTGKA